MTQQSQQIASSDVEQPSLPVMRIDGKDYVAKQELDSHMLRIVGKLTQVATRQQEQLVRLNTTVDLLYDVLAEHHPELRDSLLDAMRTRDAPV